MPENAAAHHLGKDARVGKLYRAYGLNWRSEVPLDLFESLRDPKSVVDIEVALHSGEFPPERNILISDGKITITAEGLRYHEDDVVTMDAFSTGRIALYPGTAWQGVLPHSFFSTIVGTTLALRGGLTIHGSAVEMDGKAIVLCGPSGAGKSSSIAALIANGARLISDDLTVIEPLKLNTPPAVFAGRRCIRLFSGMAGALRRSVESETIAISGAKELVTTPRVGGMHAVPLSGLIVLGSACEGNENSQFLRLKLKDLLFKPNVFPYLPGYLLRSLALKAALAGCVFAEAPVVRYEEGNDLKVLAEATLRSWQHRRLPVQFF